MNYVLNLVRRLWIIIIFLVACVMFQQKSPDIHIPASQFRADVEADRIRDITIDGAYLSGHYKDGRYFASNAPDTASFVGDLFTHNVAIATRQASGGQSMLLRGYGTSLFITLLGAVFTFAFLWLVNYIRLPTAETLAKSSRQQAVDANHEPETTRAMALEYWDIVSMNKPILIRSVRASFLLIVAVTWTLSSAYDFSFGVDSLVIFVFGAGAVIVKYAYNCRSVYNRLRKANSRVSYEIRNSTLICRDGDNGIVITYLLDEVAKSYVTKRWLIITFPRGDKVAVQRRAFKADDFQKLTALVTRQGAKATGSTNFA